MDSHSSSSQCTHSSHIRGPWLRPGISCILSSPNAFAITFLPHKIVTLRETTCGPLQMASYASTVDPQMTINRPNAIHAPQYTTQESQPCPIPDIWGKYSSLPVSSTFRDDTSVMTPHEDPATGAPFDVHGRDDLVQAQSPVTRNPMNNLPSPESGLTASAPRTATSPVTFTNYPQLSFRCGLCGMEYDAPARTDACMSQHNGTRSFGCQGACGDLHW